MTNNRQTTADRPKMTKAADLDDAVVVRALNARKLGVTRKNIKKRFGFCIDAIKRVAIERGLVECTE